MHVYVLRMLYRSVAESGETGARSGWFVALSGKSALSRGSLVAHSGHWGEICTLMIGGSVGAESGRSRGTFLSSRELIRDRQTRFKFQRSHSWRVLGTF